MTSCFRILPNSSFVGHHTILHYVVYILIASNNNPQNEEDSFQQWPWRQQHVFRISSLTPWHRPTLFCYTIFLYKLHLTEWWQAYAKGFIINPTKNKTWMSNDDARSKLVLWGTVSRVTGELAAMNVHDSIAVCTTLAPEGSTTNQRVFLRVQVKQSKGSWPQIIRLPTLPMPCVIQGADLQQPVLAVRLSITNWQLHES
jgi:hypothetical protein